MKRNFLIRILGQEYIITANKDIIPDIDNSEASDIPETADYLDINKIKIVIIWEDI